MLETVGGTSAKTSGLLFGFGRMGITHIALFNKYFSEHIDWEVYEPSWKTRLMIRALGSLANVKLVNEKTMQSKPYDLAIVCSPPQFHQTNYDQIQTNARKVFVEKPGLVDAGSAKNVYVGYVLRHAPCVTHLKSRLRSENLNKIKVEIRANTVVEQGTGWRASSTGGGVVNEFGSHAINLAKYLVGDEFNVTHFETEQVVSSHCPDICRLQGKTAAGTEVELFLNWSDNTVRKPGYLITAELPGEKRIVTDLFQIWREDTQGAKSDISGVAYWDSNCKFYIRGLEFSEQARYFSEHDDFSTDLEDSIFTDRILRENA